MFLKARVCIYGLRNVKLGKQWLLFTLVVSTISTLLVFQYKFLKTNTISIAGNRISTLDINGHLRNSTHLSYQIQLPNSTQHSFDQLYSEDHVRCGVQYFGCFCDLHDAPRFRDEFRSIKPHTTLKGCFITCSNHTLAALIGNSCICGSSYFSKEPVRTSNKCARKTVTYEQDQCPDIYASAELYRITKPCTKGRMTDGELSQQFLGYFPKSNNFDEETLLRIQNVTSKSCFLYCEDNEHTLAMMAVNGTCYCGHTTKDFRLRHQLSEDERKHKSSVAVWRTLVPDYRCASRKFLPGNTVEHTFLRSFPGSGNTWARYLIEGATGIFTGSYGKDSLLQEGGFMGEFDKIASARTIVTKNHANSYSPSKTIMLVRDPFDACVAEYTRKTSRSHTANIDYNRFNTTEWKKFPKRFAAGWLKYNTLYFEGNDPVLVVYYEDLKQDHIKEIRRIVDFIGYKPDDFEERLLCLENESTGLFKRKQKDKPLDMFMSANVTYLNNTIIKLNKLIRKQKNVATLPGDAITQQLARSPGSVQTISV